MLLRLRRRHGCGDDAEVDGAGLIVLISSDGFLPVPVLRFSAAGVYLRSDQKVHFIAVVTSHHRMLKSQGSHGLHMVGRLWRGEFTSTCALTSGWGTLPERVCKLASAAGASGHQRPSAAACRFH